MSKMWKVVSLIAIGLLVLGLVLCGAGWLTGASPERMIELAFGGTEAALHAAKTAMLSLHGLGQSLITFIGKYF